MSETQFQPRMTAGAAGAAQATAPVACIHPSGAAGLVLVCEHAARDIPPAYGDLGLNARARAAHVAWDIGALDVARGLSTALDAPLVHGTVSRLVYDCNRPLEAPDAIPARSEAYDVPGNEGLTEAERQARFDAIHTPFHDLLGTVVARKMAAGIKPAIITIHSFTPVYHGLRRDLEIGFLYHGADSALAGAALAAEARSGRFTARLNEPYAMEDGVTYTLKRHGAARGLPSLMIEIRNDLIDTPETAAAMAQHLAANLRIALAAVPDARKRAS